ncbi:MAG TPA: ATP-binding protein [Ktedonobacteraceae bacterium]|jgi:predicted kinase|nr:ATP-binding protein [Ktedonobacteraceae bacterium]
MELIIFIGLQASGKSTFYHQHFETTHIHVSKDLLHNNKKPGRRQMQLVEEALKAGQSVVVDNTNPTPVDREPLIRLGHEYGAEVIGYYFESNTRSSLERNKTREGKARVPDVAIYVTASKLASPTYAEGFDTLYDVHIAENSGFEVRAREKNEVQ